MGKVTREQLAELVPAIHSHDFLRRVLEAIEQYHRLVFHANSRANWDLVRQSAEQILVAEILTRHNGNIDGIYNTLRNMEAAGKPWGVAINELAGTMHSYFTTPLGIVMRSDLFGDQASFITPEAHDWIRRRKTSGQAGAVGEV